MSSLGFPLSQPDNPQNISTSLLPLPSSEDQQLTISPTTYRNLWLFQKNLIVGRRNKGFSSHFSYCGTSNYIVASIATALFWWTAVNNQESETLILQRELKCRLLKSASHLILDSGLVKQTTTLLAPPLPSSDDQHLSRQDSKVKCTAMFAAPTIFLKNPPRIYASPNNDVSWEFALTFCIHKYVHGM